MIWLDRLFFWLLQCILFLLTNADDGFPVRGVPGVDYPDYQTIPHTSFRCSQLGLFADPETGCQMFHHCYEHRHESFLCPSGTIFNQAILACDYWYSADCSAASSYYKSNFQHKSNDLVPETELTTNKNPSINIFNKMASLYLVKEPSSIDSGYDFKERHFFSEDNAGKRIYESENYKEYDNNILKVSNMNDRRDGVVETSDEYKYHHYENNEVNNVRIFEDFESSGELENAEEHGYSEEVISSINDGNNKMDLEKQHFENVEDFEHDTNLYLNDEHLIGYSDILGEKEDSSKDFDMEDAFIKRQSETLKNLNERKPRRRKPIYTIIESETNADVATTINPKYKMDVDSNHPTDSALYSQETVTTPKSVFTLSPSKNKRRKPVLIDLEDSIHYNVGHAKDSSISYGNSQSNIPEFSMDAEEISVKLFPSKTKRKQHQFIETKEKADSNNVGSHESNVYHTSTLSTLEDNEKLEDISMNMNQVYPKRKKNIIHIIDSEDDTDETVNNEELNDFTTFTYMLEDEFTTQSTTFDDLGKYVQPNFHEFESAHETEDSYSELAKHQQEDQDVYHTNEDLEDTTTSTPAFEDEFTTHSSSIHFEDFNEFAKSNYGDQDLEKAHEIEDDHSKQVSHLEDSYNFYIENEELEDTQTLTPIFEDFSTQSPNMNFEDFDRLAEQNFDYHDVENAHETENDQSKLLTEQYDSSYDFITEYPHVKMFDGTDNTHFIQMHPDTTLKIEEYDNTKYFEDDHEFTKYKNFHDFEIDKNEEHKYYSYFTTQSSIPDISTLTSSGISHQRSHYEDETTEFYLNDGHISESTFDDSGTSENWFTLASVAIDKNEDVSNGIKPLLNLNHNNDSGINFSEKDELEKHNVSDIVKILSADTSSNITNTDEFTNVSHDIEGNNLNVHLINESMEDILNMDSIRNIQKYPVYFEENTSSKDTFEDQSELRDTFSDVDSIETNDYNQSVNESDVETVIHKLKFNQNIHQSDEPMDTGILRKTELETVTNKGGENNEASNYDDSEIDFEDLTNILDAFENDQNDPSSQPEYTFLPTHRPNDKVQTEDSSKNIPGKTRSISPIQTKDMNKKYPVLETENPENIKPNNKATRIPRMFMPPYTRDFNLEILRRDFNFENLGYQNFANVPYSMLQLKQKSMNKFLGSSMMGGYGMEGIEDYYSTRTGDLLESPKISKLISIGKNLLNAKRAKLRILRKYVNY